MGRRGCCGLFLAHRVQEPDSFSQRGIGLFQLADATAQLRYFSRLCRPLGCPCFLQRCAPNRWNCHLTTISRNKPTVEVALEYRAPPLAQRVEGEITREQPNALPAIWNLLILMHKLADLRRGETWRDGHIPASY